ncbi:MAG TPA: hypothetical protein VNV85_12515 [Puia sp.]|jgi:hypothetical protein|nr:hypothetical protein [Puia sp.]
MQQDAKNTVIRENKTVYRCAVIACILIMGASLQRALSVNNLVVAARTGDISKHYGATVVIDWSLACVMMFLVGVWVLFLTIPLRKLQRRAWWQGIVISLAFILFGGGFWFRYPRSIHLPGFVLIGMILFVPLIIYARKFKSP